MKNKKVWRLEIPHIRLGFGVWGGVLICGTILSHIIKGDGLFFGLPYVIGTYLYMQFIKEFIE